MNKKRWILILAVFLVGAGAGWWYMQRNIDETASNDVDTNQAQDDSIEEEATDLPIVDRQLPDGWVWYENDQLGIGFGYPAEWGNVESTNFDSSTETDLFRFTDFDYMSIGGLRVTYETLGRGGSIFDYGGFAIQENGEIQLLGTYGDDAGPSDQGYVLTADDQCVFSTDIDFFMSRSYHAVCNLDRDEILGFNFVVNDPEQVSEQLFTDIVASTEVY